MSRKRLHIHSLPLVAFSLSVTTVVALSIAGGQSQSMATALIKPALRLQTNGQGTVKAEVNRTLPAESAGVQFEFMVYHHAVIESVQAFDSLGLQLALDQAAKKSE